MGSRRTLGVIPSAVDFFQAGANQKGRLAPCVVSRRSGRQIQEEREFTFEVELKDGIAVVVLRCATNDIADLKKLVPELLIKLSAAKKGEALLVG